MNNDSTSPGNKSHPQEVTNNDFIGVYELVGQQVPSSTQTAESGVNEDLFDNPLYSDAGPVKFLENELYASVSINLTIS